MGGGSPSPKIATWGMKKRKIVYICSPYRGDKKRNVTKANYCSRFAFEKGYLPLAPHAIYTQFLNDDDEEERKAGLDIGLQLLELVDELWVFGPEISEGMKTEIERARRRGIKTRYFSEAMEEE